MGDSNKKEDKLIHSIINYVNNDYIGALLLTGDWGIGKTFFVEKSLIPELNKRKIKNVFVSLYGLNSIYDLSKNLYFELVTFKFNSIKKNKFFKKTKPYFKYVGKTILKNIFKHFNVDLSNNKKNFDDFFKSLDLKKTLIILDDLERSSIDINELFGYINSLVEKENIKLLLVGNEKEIDKNEKYYQLKSKTIFNTIEFVPNDVFEIIKNIILKFECIPIKDNKVVNLLLENKYGYSINFRDFNFCCAKTQEFVKEMDKFTIEINNGIRQDFIKFVFFGILSIVFNYEYWDEIKKGKVNELLSKLFGSITNFNHININHPFIGDLSSNLVVSLPIFYNVFNFLVGKSLELSEKTLLSYIDIFLEYKKFNLKSYDFFVDNDLEKLYKFYEISNSSEIVGTVNKIDLKIEKDLIPFHQYEKISLTIFVIEKKFNLNFNNFKINLINNLENSLNLFKKWKLSFDFCFMEEYEKCILTKGFEIPKEFYEFREKIRNLINFK